MARKPRTKPEDPKPKVIEIPIGEDEGKTRDAMSEQVPGWDKLSKDEKDELTRLAVEHVKARPTKVTLTRKPDGGKTIGLTGECETLDVLKLQKIFGANSMEPVNARASELLNYLGSINADNTDRYNAALSFIESMEPRDQAEALLLVQMYCTHDAAIRALSQLGKSEWVPHSQLFGNLAVKLLRVSQGQMESLSKMRRGGEQVVRHVHVDNRGGQAVIAENVHTGGQRNAQTDDQSYAAGATGIGPALLGADPFGNGVPIPSREREAEMQDARWHEPRGTEG